MKKPQPILSQSVILILVPHLLRFPNLVAGFEYTFNITAVNSNGPSNILCGPVLHRVGESANMTFL